MRLGIVAFNPYMRVQYLLVVGKGGSFINLFKSHVLCDQSLLHKRDLTLVLGEFQHRFKTDVETTIIESRYFSTSILKTKLKIIIYIDSS